MQKWPQFTPDRIIAVFVGAWFLLITCVYYSQINVPLYMYSFLGFDEFSYLRKISYIQNQINAGYLEAAILYLDTYGYGTFFWMVYGIGTNSLNSYLSVDSGVFLFALRMITVAFQCATLVISVRILQLLEVRRIGILIFFLLILAMPGLFLTYKPFSPDYMGTFFTLCGAYFLIKAMQSDLQWKELILAGLFLGVGANVKLSNGYGVVLFLSLAVAHKMLDANVGSLKIIQRGAGVALSALGGFFIAAPGFIFSPRGYYNEILKTHDINNKKNTYAIEENNYFDRLITWFVNPKEKSLSGISTSGIRDEFIGYGLLVLLILVLVWVVKRRTSLGKPTSHLVAFFLSGIVCIFLTILLLNRIWTWHLITPMFIMVIGFSGVLEHVLHIINKSTRLTRLLSYSFLVMVFSIHIFMGISGISIKIKNFQVDPKYVKRNEELYNSCVGVVASSRQKLHHHQILIDVGLPRSPQRGERQCWEVHDFMCYKDLNKLNDDMIKVIVFRKDHLGAPALERLIGMGFKSRECAPNILVIER